MKTDYIFELNMKVRDYECDLQGIVNNANYQHYIEHTRHEFLLSKGISFADLHARGIDAVVARLNMAFKTPLKSGDSFVSKLRLVKDGIKYVFYQDIFRLPDMKCCIKSQVDTVCLIQGRLGICQELDQIVPTDEINN
ncbi:MAG TPA: acyl-CoA thioesterase [Candidatus Paraprevotella stercorigallinarum]|jgi:acyl-CoA thioester hydrolase|nr:acyl-CoA thioesterase [Candidatus Paraprevotella stercorigallinarum]